MKLFLPREKFLNLKQLAPEIMFQVPTASCVASFLGLCQSTIPIILETLLHIRAIQRPGSHKGHSSPGAVCILQDQGYPFSGGNKRSADVDRFSPLKQWKKHNSPTSRHNDFLQCLTNRMGCPPRFNLDRKKMVEKRPIPTSIFWN